jgi:hypothetical protein
VADIYHEMLETVCELLNDVSDDKFLKDAIDSGLLNVCKDVFKMYTKYFNYYQGISNKIYLDSVNEYNINRDMFQVLLILKAILSANVSAKC